MREISVYTSGAYQTPGYLHAYSEATSTYRRVTTVHIYRNAVWEEVWNQGTLYVPNSATVLSILKAPTVAANNAYWNTLMTGGRRLGDINNSGSVSSTDSNLMLFYVVGSTGSLTTDQINWIETVIIPYATDYPPP